MFFKLILFFELPFLTLFLRITQKFPQAIGFIYYLKMKCTPYKWFVKIMNKKLNKKQKPTHNHASCYAALPCNK